jgi:hypothetical protein
MPTGEDASCVRPSVPREGNSSLAPSPTRVPGVLHRQPTKQSHWERSTDQFSEDRAGHVAVIANGDVGENRHPEALETHAAERIKRSEPTNAGRRR